MAFVKHSREDSSPRPGWMATTYLGVIQDECGELGKRRHFYLNTFYRPCRKMTRRRGEKGEKSSLETLGCVRYKVYGEGEEDEKRDCVTLVPLPPSPPHTLLCPYIYTRVCIHFPLLSH